MLTKNILVAFTLAGLAIAIPVEDIQERVPAPCWCCATALSFNIFFIKKVGSKCVANPSGGDCKAPLQPLCCDSLQKQIVDPKSGGVVCTV